MDILFENSDYLICVKAPELVTEHTEKQDGLADLLATRNGGYIGIIHRLDKGVGGLTVWAKTEQEAARLSKLAQEHRLGKEYVAWVEGEPEDSGSLRDLLYFDRLKNKVFPVKKERGGVKKAELEYRVTKRAELPGIGKISRVCVNPITGRTHQIRVQFASRRFPVLGDRKYGGQALPDGIEARGILLACHRLVIPTADGNQIYTWEPDWLNMGNGQD